jgi:IS30 family transposase
MACQLTLSEREQIAQFSGQRLSWAEIARRLGRHRSTIGRELARNGDRAAGRGTGVTYWPSMAQQKARARRQHRPRKMDHARLNDDVRRGLAKCWSPEQIAGRGRREHPHEPRRRVSHTTIYRWIAESTDREHWESFLRFGRRRKTPETRGRLPARAEIAGRPAIVDERRRFGDWEGDTIVGARRQSGLVTLVERKSGFALVAKVQRLRARNVTSATTRQFAPLPPSLRRTATFDNGKEFAGHQQIARQTNLDIYFARPYHAWERGANESFNGLLRQFFPKGTDFKGISPLEVKQVRNLLNDRPRKRLGYRTPKEVLGKHFPVAFDV